MNRSDVFISYRRTEAAFVRQLDRALKEAEKEVWVDWEDIPPASTDFSEDILRGIDGADVFICVLSPRYFQSAYCMGELDYAVKNNKKLVPLVFEKFDGQVKEIPVGIAHINWVYFCPHAGAQNTFEEALPLLIEALDADLDYIAEHTRLLLRARQWERNDSSPAFLLRGDELTAAETWLAGSV